VPTKKRVKGIRKELEHRDKLEGQISLKRYKEEDPLMLQGANQDKGIGVIHSNSHLNQSTPTKVVDDEVGQYSPNGFTLAKEEVHNNNRHEDCGSKGSMGHSLIYTNSQQQVSCNQKKKIRKNHVTVGISNTKCPQQVRIYPSGDGIEDKGKGKLQK